jgi:ketosteroid isomerase-like protein
MHQLVAFVLCFMLCSIGLFAEAPDPKTEKEILAAMEAWKEAMLNRDRSALEKLYAPDLTYTHSNGRQENKTEAIDAVVNSKDRTESIELAGLSVRVYGKTALVKGKVTLNNVSNGKPVVLILDVLHVWVKSSSGWQLVARQSTRLNP